MTNLYALLEVSKGASEKEIKTAYRRLAKKYHPDVNQNDPKVAAKFQEITAAYDILSDKQKRQHYDAGQIDDQGNPTNPFASGGGGSGNPFSHSGFDFGGSGFSADDLFSSIFGGMGGRKSSAQGAHSYQTGIRGEDRNYTLKVGFSEAALGTTRQITLGNGKTVSLKIPAGTKNHDKLRLKGSGDPGHGQGEAGDAFIEILVAEHPYFTRDGLTIYLELPLTIYEAALGAKVKVPTLHGSLSLKIPKGSQSGQTLRLKGKGIHKKNQQGDQLVKLQIMLPETETEPFENFMKSQEEQNPYNPRTKFGMN